MNDPAIFISTVTREFASTRQRVANILTRLGYAPVWQDVFGTEPGDLRQMLRDKIDGCEGFVQIVGEAFGAEPPTADAEFGRVSYTQFEFLYAERCRKKTWLIFADHACTRDVPLDQLDLPADPHHSDPVAYQTERRQLQQDYCQRLKAGGHLRYQPVSDDQLDLTIERLRDELAELRRGFRRWQKNVVRAMAVVALLVVCVLGGLWWMKRSQQQGFAAIAAGQKVTSARIRAHLLEASEQKRDEELALAEKEPTSEERERLREAATKAHTLRVSRIDDLADSFTELEKQEDATPVFREMTRILSEEGVDAALAYADRQRQSVLDRVHTRAAAFHEQNRTELLPLLKAADLQSTKGQTAEARSSYQQLLDLEPDWPDGLQAFAWFLYDQSFKAETDGTLSAAVTDAEQSLALAQRLQAQDQARPQSQRVLAVALGQMADVVIQRGQPGDAEQALQDYTRSLDLSEALLKANPDSAQATRDVSVGLNGRGDFLAKRGQPGDAEQALQDYTRSLDLSEALLTANPDSAQAAQDVSTSLNRRGDFLYARGQPGDAEQALQDYTRCLDLSEALLTANPDSAQATRGVSVSLNRRGAFLAARGQPGDAEQALQDYTRSLNLSEALLKANPDSVQATRDVSVTLEFRGAFLAARGQPGDAEQALQDYTRGLDIREALLKANPDSAEAALHVAISYVRMAALAERTGHGDAMASWRRAYDILAELKARGGLMQANEEQLLDYIRAKVGKSDMEDSGPQHAPVRNQTAPNPTR
jgi:tetratricopeptide (TPR) repeat protein